VHAKGFEEKQGKVVKLFAVVEDGGRLRQMQILLQKAQDVRLRNALSLRT
jgi:hypothetical protein